MHTIKHGDVSPQYNTLHLLGDVLGPLLVRLLRGVMDGGGMRVVRLERGRVLAVLEQTVGQACRQSAVAKELQYDIDSADMFNGRVIVGVQSKSSTLSPSAIPRAC